MPLENQPCLLFFVANKQENINNIPVYQTNILTDFFFSMAVIFILQIQPNFILRVIMFQTMFKICLENTFHYHSMSVLVCHVCKLLNEKIMKIYD